MERPRSVPFKSFGKVQTFEIVLDRRDGPNGMGIFCPGDLLTGHVRLDLLQRLTVRNIDLLVQGTGHAAWKLRGLQGDEQLISDDEVYLNEIAELVSRRHNEMVSLSPGEHIFPFACELPWNLPATFTGTHGNVTYSVKVVLQAERNETVHREPCVATCVFLLETRLALEGLSDQLNAFRIDRKHPVKTSGSVKVSLFLPRRAYDIDDSVLVNMSLTNTSKRPVLCMTLELVMEPTYQAQGRTATERLLVADHEDKFTVRHLESRQWRHVGLKVPRCIPPSGLPNSTLISVRYSLVLKVQVDRLQEPLTLQTPVIIGMELPDEIKMSAAFLDAPDGASAVATSISASGAVDDVASGSQRILYQSSREPPILDASSTAAAAGPSLPRTSGALQRPLYVDVKQQQPQQPKSQLLQVPHQSQPQRPRSGSDSDSQVISMRFTDELDDHSPYRQPYQLRQGAAQQQEKQQQQQQEQQQQQQQQHYSGVKVSRNPLYSAENGANDYQELQGAAAMEPGLGEGVEDVLY